MGIIPGGDSSGRADRKRENPARPRPPGAGTGAALRVEHRQESARRPAPGSRSLNEFAVKMGLDAVLADPDFTREQVAPGRWRTEWGYTIQESEEEHGVEVDSPIHSMEDLSRYTPPDPGAAGRYAAIEKTLADYGKTHAVIVHLNDVFSIPRYLMGYESILMGIAAEPGTGPGPGRPFGRRESRDGPRGCGARRADRVHRR